MDFTLTLEKGSRKHHCPQCGKRTFVRYINAENGEYLPAHYGRCDRQEKCAYHLNPYRDGYHSAISQAPRTQTAVRCSPVKKREEARPVPGLVPNAILERTLKGYDQNVFLQNLIHRVPFPFDPADVETVARLYRLGTITKGDWIGATTFPFVDEMDRARYIQVKKFDDDNHTAATGSLTAIISKHYLDSGRLVPEWLEAYYKADLKVSCLFGAHLLTAYPNHTVALVEAPKTAVYGALYYGLPESSGLIWLAVYSRDTLTVDKCRVLRGRTVYLFPDLSRGGSTFALWKNQARKICEQVPGVRVKVIDILEAKAGDEDREKGADLADFLINYDWREFRTAMLNDAASCKSTKENPALSAGQHVVANGAEAGCRANASCIVIGGDFGPEWDVPQPDPEDVWVEFMRDHRTNPIVCDGVTRRKDSSIPRAFP